MLSPMKNNEKDEYIICAAIWFDDGKKHEFMPVQTGIVIAGHRHHNCFAIASQLTELMGGTIDTFHNKLQQKAQGFLTSKGRFVDRWQAMYIAYTAGQVNVKRAFTLSEKWMGNDFDFEGFLKSEPRRYYDKDETPLNKLFSEDLY